MTISAPTVPSFVLYGDIDGQDAPTLMHIETIAARSTLHDWEIADHRHDRSFQLLLVRKGQAVAQVGEQTELLRSPSFLCVPQGAVHGFRFEPGTEGYVVTLSSDFLARTTETDPLRQLLTAGGHGALPEDAVQRIDWLAAELLRLSQIWPFDHRLAGSLFEALLCSLPDTRSDLPLDPRLARFRGLLEQHLSEHQPVSFYASQVGLSQRSLARLCMRHFACTPRQAINRRMALEAQRMLRHTAASVFQTSDALGFKDPSYFSRFYLRETGRRPQRDKAVATVSKRRDPLRPSSRSDSGPARSRR
jgi:AraC family transcriptional activator of pobA